MSNDHINAAPQASADDEWFSELMSLVVHYAQGAALNGHANLPRHILRIQKHAALALKSAPAADALDRQQHDPSRPKAASPEDQAVYDSMAANHFDRQRRGGDVDIKAVYTQSFGSDAGWYGSAGSYFIEGYRAALADKPAVSKPAPNDEQLIALALEIVPDATDEQAEMYGHLWVRLCRMALARYGYGLATQPAASDQDRLDIETGRRWRENSSLEAWFPLTAEELESTKRMFSAAIADLAAISEHLGVDPDDGGADPILSAIDKLAAHKPDGGDAIHSLITEKFSSGNAIPVERITLTRAEYDVAISAQQRKGE